MTWSYSPRWAAAHTAPSMPLYRRRRRRFAVKIFMRIEADVGAASWTTRLGHSLRRLKR